MSIRTLKRWALLLTFWVAIQGKNLRATPITGDTVSGNFTATGNADIQGATLSFGMRSDNSNPGWAASYTDGSNAYVDFLLSRSSGTWRWSQNAGSTSKLQLTLDNNNKLILFDQSSTPVAKITLDPLGTSAFANSVTLSGTNNTMPNQTLTGSGSVITEGLGDSRYASSSSVSLLTSHITIGSGTYAPWSITGPNLSFNGGMATGVYSFAEGPYSTASGPFSIAMGNSSASGDNSTASGFYSTASGNYSVAMGCRSTASGYGSTALGVYSTASGISSTAMGWGATASGYNSTAMTFGIASGPGSLAMPYSTASGGESVAMASGTATAQSSLAFGCESTASSLYAMALGFGATASGESSTATGYFTNASGIYSTASGFYTTASGYFSTASGMSTTASGGYSTALGKSSTASGLFSIASGRSTTASSYFSLVIGAFNTGQPEVVGATASVNTWVPTDPIFEIGNGGDGTYGNPYATQPSDALVVYKDGDVKAQGVITCAPGGDIPMYTGY